MNGLENAVERLGAKWVLTDPAELWRTEAQAQGWFDFVRMPESLQQHYGGELEAIREHASAIVKRAIQDLNTNKNFNVIDLGCGDGRKGIEFAFAAFNSGNRQWSGGYVWYIPVDQNAGFVESAAKEARMRGLAVKDLSAADFFAKDYSEYRIRYAPSSFYLLLGNINHSLEEITGFMKKVTSERDAFIIGTELMIPDVSAMLERYRTNTKLDDWFFMTAQRMGFEREAIVFNPQFNHATRRVEYGYDIIFPSKGTGTQHLSQPGDRLVLALSLRPTEQQLKEWLGQHFSVTVYVNRENTAALAYCTR